MHLPRNPRTFGHPPLAAATALAVVMTLWASAALAQNLVISNLVVDNQAGTLFTRFSIGSNGLAEISEALKGGATLGLTCKARLKGRGSLIGNAQIASAEATSRLRLDPLTKEYTLTVPGREAAFKGPRLDEVLRAGWGELTLDLGTWRVLERGQEYTLTLDVRLQQTDIPNWFKRTLFFWSWDVLPSTSSQLHFKH